MKDKGLLQYFAKVLGVDVDTLHDKKHHYNVSTKGFMMFTTGSNCVFKGYKEIIEWCKQRYDNKSAERVMDGEFLYEIENRLRQDGYVLEGHHLVFEHVKNEDLCLPIGYTTKLIQQPEIEKYYKYKEFDNAFSFNKEEDCLAIATLYNDEVIAMVACDNRIESSWQIGIDVVKDHRGKGLATYLVSEIAKEIKKLGKTPFYTTWGANIGSLKVAINAGFTPTASYYYAKKVKE